MPPSVRTDQLLRWQTLTGMVNLTKPSLNFWSSLLFGDHETLSTETVELSYLEGDREAAPFVRTHAAGILVPGDDEKFAVVEAPNIRIKANLHASKMSDQRHPGDTLMVMPGENGPILTGAQRYVARRLARLNDRVTNTMEVLASQIVQGQISYSVDGGDSFQITLPRASANNVALTALQSWGQSGTPGASLDIPGNFEYAKDTVADALGLPITHAVFGVNAATAFRNQAKSGSQLHGILDNRNIQVAGTMEIGNSPMGVNGAIYYGNLFGVQCWGYNRTINVNGVATKMVRDDYVEFVSAVPEAEDITYFGSIPDLDAQDEGNFVGERFSKSWKEKDPSSQQILVHSRPLPWCRKPNSKVSMKVTNI